MSDPNELFNGLVALAATAFPKVCQSCGMRYETAEDYFAKTRAVGQSSSGLKHAEEDDGVYIVELFRNCVCGSTMLEFFNDRRDASEQGLRRRQIFGQLLDKLVASGMAHDIARAELLKVLRGEPSRLIKDPRTP
ncbi:MAG: oxidoreductase [Pseudomonadota bacterium]